jgi:CubicO group peptidase (beta-lactamase class C family)
MAQQITCEFVSLAPTTLMAPSSLLDKLLMLLSPFVPSSRRKAIGTASIVVALCAADATAQPPTSTMDPATLRRSSFLWSQAEREFGFANWDAIYSGRTVPRGARVRVLPAGPSFELLKPGTPGAQAMERFITDEKVAGLIVLHDGTIRLERYALGYSPRGRWVSQSVAKAMTSTLVGAAVKDGFIGSTNDPVTKYIVALKGSAYEGVTIRQLMTMTSGVKWNEDYTDPNSDVAQFYSAPLEPEIDATVSYMRKLPREATPGTKWVYKTGETHLLGVVVTSATRQTLASYLSAKIWAPYGMEQSATWTTDRKHHELAGCCLQAALRDYARFGQFVLDGGRIDGRSVVPDGWFEAATKKQFATADPNRGYGYQWWTMDGNSFAAIGIHGQLIYVDPSRRLVVAINSAWPVATGADRSGARRQFLTLIASAVDAERKNRQNRQ